MARPCGEGLSQQVLGECLRPPWRYSIEEYLLFVSNKFSAIQYLIYARFLMFGHHISVVQRVQLRISAAEGGVLESKRGIAYLIS